MPATFGEQGVRFEQCPIGPCKRFFFFSIFFRATTILTTCGPLPTPGGRCKCYSFSLCNYDEPQCYQVYKCRDRDGQGRCTKLRSCDEDAYEDYTLITLSCARPDLRNTTKNYQRELGRELKAGLTSANNTCNFKPCGYKMENANDIVVVRQCSSLVLYDRTV